MLKVRATATASDDKPANVVSIAYTGRSPTFLADTAFQALLQQWLNANLSDFDHVFATVNIDRTADAGAFQWMQPTDVAYAYSDLGTPGDGALGVLCMTKKRPPTGLTQQLSGAIIPALQRAGFAIAKERLLAELLLPAMPHLFPGSAPTDYALSSTGEAIVAAAGNTVSFTVKTAATANTRAKTYQAKVVDLQLTVESAEMKLSVTTETVISPGIRAYCKTQDFLGLHLVDKPDGTQTLGYFDSRPATNDHWTEKDEGLEITEDILGAIALALAALATVGTGGALIGVAALIVGLVVGVMFLTTTLIEDVHRDDAPSIDSLMLNGTTAVTWPDSKDFRLASVELSDSLHLGGALA
ncbi:MAG: hypothetical protein E5Y32_02405 [Mesorhizobium sp.]|nr:MAG: hypothetical protein E5Y32_02405 [Mesorhizobium sp.]